MKKIPEFLENADNVYSTMNFIVAQKLVYIVNEIGVNVLLSVDRYYKRTAQRDKEYSKLYPTNEMIRGARIHSELYTRLYIE